MKTVLKKFHLIFLNLPNATKVAIVSKGKPTISYFTSEQQHLEGVMKSLP